MKRYLKISFSILGMFWLASCSQNQAEIEARSTVEMFYTELNNLDFAKAKTRLSSEFNLLSSVAKDLMIDPEMDELRLRLKMLKTKILSVKVDANRANVQVNVSQPLIQPFDLLVPEIKANLEADNDSAVITRMNTLIASGMINVNAINYRLTLIKEADAWLISDITKE